MSLPPPVTPARRKGAARVSDVSPALRAALEAGETETATLPEMLAIDLATLLGTVVPALAAQARSALSPELGISRRMAAAGALLWTHLGEDAFTLAGHRSDSVRGWAAYALAAAPGLDLAERLARIRPLADDAHFGVREWAWLALRPHLAAALADGLTLLLPWTDTESANLRRFAVEITRPRGVWCSHLPALKADPAPALPLLAAVRADPARYVQDSVANWLNDAAKSNPAWVRAVCADWMAEASTATPATPATAYITRRALRSCGAQAGP